MKERYLLIKENRIDQIADGVLKLGQVEETHIAVANRKELVTLLPILNDYGNDNNSGRHLPKSFIMDVTPSYARRLKREITRSLSCMEE